MLHHILYGFSPCISCKMHCMKIQKMNEKEAGHGPYFNCHLTRDFFVTEFEMFAHKNEIHPAKEPHSAVKATRSIQYYKNSFGSICWLFNINENVLFNITEKILILIDGT